MQEQNSQADQLSIILKSVLNPNQNIRQQAEEQINNFLLQNFGQFLIELSKKLSTETEEKEVRQVSATIIKNMVNKAQYAQEWFNLPENIKKGIKDNVLSTLNSSDIDIRKAAAFAVAGICKIEIPKKQWMNIFDILISTSQNNNINVQLSSLKALEYIYEEIKKGDIPNETVANLLNTYYSLLNNDKINPQLAINALNSILKFLPFISDFINDPESKINFYDLIEKYVKNDNEEIRKTSLQIFLEICKTYYDSLEDYIEKIFLFTKVIIEKDIESNKILCINIWCIIGYVEDYRNSNIKFTKKKSYGFLQKFYQPLAELCLNYIITEDYNNEEDSISKICYTLLSFMSRCCSYNFISFMLKYIGANINSNIEKIKYSALSVFKAIIYTIHKEELYCIIKDSLTMVSDILLNNNAPIYFKILCASIIKSITKNYSEELINDTIYFDKMITLYLELFKNSPKEVLCDLLLSLNNLCKNVEWSEDDQTNVLSKHMHNLCIPLMKMCSNPNFYDTKYNVIFKSFLALGTLGERSALDVKNQMIDYFKGLAEMFQKTLDDNNIIDKNICYNYQEYLASCLTGFLTTGKAEKNATAVLLQNVLNSFEKRKGLYDEGMTLIGCISLFTGKYFDAVMQLISPYLIKGLNSIDSPSLCKNSIICLSDIIRGLEEQNKYTNVFLPLILNILSNDNVEQSVKPYCFMILSDLFMYCPADALKSFNNIMKVIGAAMQATQIKFDENSEQETCNNFINLRENILETITCIFSAIKDINQTKEFIPFVNNIINYINFIGNDFACSINIIISGLCLIGDFCNVYKGDIKPLLDTLLISEMFNKIKNDQKVTKDLMTQENINFANKSINYVYLNY